MPSQVNFADKVKETKQSAFKHRPDTPYVDLAPVPEAPQEQQQQQQQEQQMQRKLKEARQTRRLARQPAVQQPPTENKPVKVRVPTPYPETPEDELSPIDPEWEDLTEIEQRVYAQWREYEWKLHNPDDRVHYEEILKHQQAELEALNPTQPFACQRRESLLGVINRRLVSVQESRRPKQGVTGNRARALTHPVRFVDSPAETVEPARRPRGWSVGSRPFRVSAQSVFKTIEE